MFRNSPGVKDGSRAVQEQSKSSFRAVLGENGQETSCLRLRQERLAMWGKAPLISKRQHFRARVHRTVNLSLCSLIRYGGVNATVGTMTRSRRVCAAARSVQRPVALALPPAKHET